MTAGSRYVRERIERPADEAYADVVDPASIPRNDLGVVTAAVKCPISAPGRRPMLDSVSFLVSSEEPE